MADRPVLGQSASHLVDVPTVVKVIVFWSILTLVLVATIVVFVSFYR